MGIPQAARRKSSARSALWMEEDSRDSFECTRYKCLDLERQRAEYHTLVTRINKHPVDRACEKYAYDKQTEEERRRKLKKKEEINLVGNISEIFESFESDTRKPWLPGSCQQDASKPSSASRKSHKPQGIYAVRGIALTDCRELVGKESELLKRLLRTMRVKRWDPDLYFQMKFFEMRHKLPPFSQEKKEMV
ncbi:hypothetical protein BaRGS_00010096 [Batillaria attramentaria]|uniref:Uncharacterized protein n=1 Tax=Batillaria attramentaria TaxID=370345 RepID=A0ABD0LGK3_9CAEN